MANTSKPTDHLKEEHQNVKKKLDTLEHIFQNLDKKDEVSDKLKELASFFKTEFWVHFTKEEEALFPEMEKYVPKDMGPIGMMLEEHVALKNTNEELQKLYPVYLGNSGNAETITLIKRHGFRFIQALRDHIYKEDNVLFMMADEQLNKSQVDSINNQFKDIENKQTAG
ncbi:MAG: hemerythrin domain-containing protein [Dehalococcoidia bacterium]|nr:hemerythrin domain-containing protein [Dehalococcoidia bacterium]